MLPIGARLIWRDGARFNPFYVIKAGVAVYTQKAFSQDAAYENFALDQSLGCNSASMAAPISAGVWRLSSVERLRRAQQPKAR